MDVNPTDRDLTIRRDYLLIVHSALMIITTMLKLVIIGILCFYVAPIVEKSTEESQLNRAQIIENREQMTVVEERITVSLSKIEETHRMAKRIHDILDNIERIEREKQKKKSEEKDKDKKDKDKKD